MKLLVDHADINLIKEMYEYYPVNGVTTNPTILTKSGRAPYEVLKEIRAFIGQDADLHAQVVSEDAEGMIREAHNILRELGDNTFVKIPVNREGLKAIRLLAKDDIRITGTGVYTTAQVYLAGEAGAAYAAPYVNRIDGLAQDGVAVVKAMQDIIDNNGMMIELLAASFKNTRQVMELAQYGIGAATCPPDVIEGLLFNDSVNAAVAAMNRDFHAAYGADTYMG